MAHPKEIVNFSTNVYSSIYGTLDSIQMLLKNGRLNDAYCLIRKYYDVILIDIYIEILIKKNNDNILRFFEKEISVNSLYDENVVKWVEGKFRIPKIDKIMKILKSSTYTQDIYSYFGWESNLKKIRELLDNNIHGNSIYYLILNCKELYLDEREKELRIMEIIMKQFMSLHLAFIFHLNPEYMMASDYMESLECGCNPPEGSDSWIAPYAQNAFDQFIKPKKKLATFIKQSCYLNIE